MQDYMFTDGSYKGWASTKMYRLYIFRPQPFSISTTKNNSDP
jgi:hypothetical protein